MTAQQTVEAAEKDMQLKVAELISLQARMEQAVQELPAAPVQTNIQPAVHSTLAMAKMAAANSMISPQEEFWFQKMMEKMCAGVTGLQQANATQPSMQCGYPAGVWSPAAGGPQANQQWQQPLQHH